MIFRRTMPLCLLLALPVLPGGFSFTPRMPAAPASTIPSADSPARASAASAVAPVLARGAHAFPHLMPGKTLRTHKVWNHRRKSIELRGDIPVAAIEEYAAEDPT